MLKSFIFVEQAGIFGVKQKNDVRYLDVERLLFVRGGFYVQAAFGKFVIQTSDDFAGSNGELLFTLPPVRCL